MRITLHAVGRLKSGAERTLAEHYLERAEKAGRSVGIMAVSLREIGESRARHPLARKEEEASHLLAALDQDALILALDERGEALSSEEFAALLSEARDRNCVETAILIGGPDGHGGSALMRAKKRLSFGRFTLPHQIVRILAAEQVYRAMTILSGHPYHRA